MRTPPVVSAPVPLGSLIPGGNPGELPLSVADVQQALRELRGRQAPTQLSNGGDTAVRADPSRGDIQSSPTGTRGDTARRVIVAAAHAGAGSSVVALAISDAAAASGRSVHLVDASSPGRSGLVAAASTELGVDETGTWRRGLRSTIVVDRRAVRARAFVGGPAYGLAAELTVLDVGSDTDAAPSNSAIVMVCRPTVPGVRMAERYLAELGDREVLVAAVGPSGWAREVRASTGPRLLELRELGRIVSVPLDARLHTSGLTDRPLPKAVLAAGAQLLSLLDDVHAASDGAPITTATRGSTRSASAR